MALTVAPSARRPFTFGMKWQIFGLRVAGALFGLGACVHVARLLTGFRLVIGSWDVPLWLNGVGALIGLLLSGWFWTIARLR